MKHLNQRETEIDVMRGIAITTMIFANSIPYITHSPHPYFYRVIGSFAAPLFIFLSGYVVGLPKPDNSIKNTLRLISRGLLIIAVGLLIDVFIWRIYPFTTFDVLYLIGFGMAIVALLKRYSPKSLLIIALCVFLTAFLVQLFGTYEPGVREFNLNGTTPDWPVFDIRAFTIDGWFPLFPWLGFMLLGYCVSQFRQVDFSSKKIKYAAFFVFFLGITAMQYQTRYVREGYSELFYPPDFTYTVTALSFLALLLSFKPFFKVKIWLPMELLGKCSLFMYILHTLIIKLLFVDSNYYFPNVFFTYVAFLAGLIIIAWLLNEFKKKWIWEKLPYLLRFLLGS